MEELLINLIDNAVRYTREGEVKISVYEADGGEAVISISDTGIGIPAEHIPRIFERFYVVDKSRSRESGGTGLGLAIVKHIVERLGGTISVESKPGKGSTFISSFMENIWRKLLENMTKMSFCGSKKKLYGLLNLSVLKRPLRQFSNE
ncbi:MAG: ATP-binding protein [Deltaproteobacteria bacterium]|nr:ATP-binding protein [Deltaproteobacteria bacterium]